MRIPPAPKAPSAQVLAKVAAAVGAPANGGEMSAASAKIVQEMGPGGVAITTKPELDPNSEEVKLAKALGKAGHIRAGNAKANREAMNAKLGVTEAAKAQANIRGGHMFEGSMGSSDGLPPIRIPGVGSSDSFAPTVEDDGEFAPTCGDDVMESADPLAAEILRTHPGGILGNLSRWYHKQGEVGHSIAEGLDGYMAQHDDLHRLEKLPSGASRIHCRKAVTPKLDEALATKGGPAVLAAVLRVGRSNRIEHLVNALSDGTPAAAPQAQAPAQAEPVNVRAVAAAALQSSVSAPPRSHAATPSATGVSMPTPSTPAKKTPFLEKAIAKAGAPGASPAPKANETTSPSVVVDVTYTPAGGPDANRGIVDNIIFIGRQNGLLTYEAASYDGKMACHFKSDVFAGQFVKELTKLGNGGANTAIKGASIRGKA